MKKIVYAQNDGIIQNKETFGGEFAEKSIIKEEELLKSIRTLGVPLL